MQELDALVVLAGQFPHDAVPDGNEWASHHYVYMAGFALLCGLLLLDDEEHDPWVLIGGVLLSWFAWHYLWGAGRPVTGAVLAMVGVSAALASVLFRPVWNVGIDDRLYELTKDSRYPIDWRTRHYDQRMRALIIIALLAAMDDLLEHAFGWWMPLDYVWKEYLWYYFQASVQLGIV